MEQRDVIAAIATAAGTGAVGIIRLSGTALLPRFAPLLGRPSLNPRVATLCTFRGAENEALDTGLALYFPAPASYTGEDVLELQGHGGSAVLELLLMRCLELGARLAQPGEFTYRAYLNDRLDLAQAEAVADLIEAKSAAAARSAVRALAGEFSERVNALVADLTDLRVLVEGYLDFPEEDVDFFSADRGAQRLAGIEQALEALGRSARQGQLLRGANVVLAGPPNAGKSSLLNRLAGDELAIVTPMPGTTRDIVRATIQLNGVAVDLLDTAGLRESDDPVEQLGVQRTRAAAQQAHLVLLIEDCTEASGNWISPFSTDVPTLLVRNKADLLGEPPEDDDLRVHVSAKTGLGMDRLRASIAGRLGLADLEEGAFLARARHLEAFERASRHISAARLAHRDLVLFAEELRLAQAALGEITGELSSDDLLGHIFSRFCIGK